MQEEGLPDFVKRCTELEENEGTDKCQAIRIAPTNLYVGTLSDTNQAASYDAIIVISSDKQCAKLREGRKGHGGPPTLHLLCSTGKLGSRALRAQLHLLEPFLSPLFASQDSPRILIACANGKDLSVGVALTMLCLFFDDHCTPKPTPSSIQMEKTLIRRRFAKITEAKPDANPSRTTLQSVHSFLMPRQG